MRTLTRETQRAIDQWAVSDLGLSMDVLMASAGHAVAHVISNARTATATEAVLCFAGGGNNGGDAWVAARLLHAQGYQTWVYQVAEPKPDSVSHRARQAALACGVRTLTQEALERLAIRAPFILIDGVLGTGYDAARPMDSVTLAALQRMQDLQAQGAEITSIDLPSGVDANSGCTHPHAIHADQTVTFLCPKQGMVSWPGRGHCGVIRVAGLGIPETLWGPFADAQAQALGQRRVIQKDEAAWRTSVPTRKPDQHKGESGRILILAGSPETPGAAILALTAATRSGAGLTYTYIDSVLQAPLLVRAPDAVIRCFTDDLDAQLPAIQEAIQGCEVTVLGPGSGVSRRTRTLLALAIRDAKRCVLDADALTLISQDREAYFSLFKDRLDRGLDPVVLTPHPGEFARIFPELKALPRIEATDRAARMAHCVIILKGAGTVAACPDPETAIYVNGSGNSGLARGGSGDLLAGLIGSLLLRVPNVLEAVALAVYIHGDAADRAVAMPGQTETTHHFEAWLEALPSSMGALGFN